MPLMLLSLLIAAPVLLLPDGGAHAAQPEPWQLGLQPAATPIMEMIHRFNNGLLVVVTLIVLFVLFSLASFVLAPPV